MPIAGFILIFLLRGTRDVLANSRPCEVQGVKNGEFGRYITSANFEQINEGDLIKNNESLTLRCYENYIPFPRQNNSSGGGIFEEQTTCEDGIWSTYLSCRSSSCGYPPRIKNGYPIVGNRTHPGRNHGAVVTYVCRNDNILVERGKVICHFGEWVGVPAECKEIDGFPKEVISTTKSPHRESLRRPRLNKRRNSRRMCSTRVLRKYIGLKVPEENFFNHSANFEIQCHESYNLSTPGAKITCTKGRWIVPEELCIQDGGGVIEHNSYAEGNSRTTAPVRRWRGRNNRRRNKKKKNSKENFSENETSTAEMP